MLFGASGHRTNLLLLAIFVLVFVNTWNYFLNITSTLGWVVSSPRWNHLFIFFFLLCIFSQNNVLTYAPVLPYSLLLSLNYFTPVWVSLEFSLHEIHNVLLTNTLNKIHPFLVYYVIGFFTYIGICSLVLIFKLNYASTGSNPLLNTHRRLGSLFVLTAAALSLGAFWADQLITWGGWWVWDPSETLILILLVLVFVFTHNSISKRQLYANLIFLFVCLMSLYGYWIYVFMWNGTALHSFTTITDVFYRGWNTYAVLSLTAIFLILSGHTSTAQPTKLGTSYILHNFLWFFMALLTYLLTSNLGNTGCFWFFFWGTYSASYKIYRCGTYLLHLYLSAAFVGFFLLFSSPSITIFTHYSTPALLESVITHNQSTWRGDAVLFFTQGTLLDTNSPWIAYDTSSYLNYQLSSFTDKILNLFLL